MIIVTPSSLLMYWRGMWLSPLDWRFWSFGIAVGWLHLLLLALFAAIGGSIIERARLSTYLEGVHSKMHSTSELVLTAALMSLLVLVFGTAIMLSADSLNFMRAVSVFTVLVVGFCAGVLLLVLGYRKRGDIVMSRLLTKAGLVLCGLMITVTPLSLYEYLAFRIYPFSGWGDWRVEGAPMTLFSWLIVALFAVLGGTIIQRAQSAQEKAKPDKPAE